MSRKTQYDWPKLKTEFITGDFLTVKSFLEAHQMKAINFLNKTSGWTNDRKAYALEREQKTKEKLMEADVEDDMTIRQRQARLARYMQLKGAAELKNLQVESVEDARKLVQTGLQEERRALGMEGGGNHQSLTQININSGPKTNIDKLVEGMDYEQLLGFIAELKQQRTKLIGTEVADNSAAEIEDGEIL